MLSAVRQSPNALTLACLAAVTTMLIVAISLLAGIHRDEDVRALLMFLLISPFAWWLFAKMGGGIWKMNNGLSWKFLVCTGALGLTMAALTFDLVLLVLVRRWYTGTKKLNTCILTM
jgi:hypothetical protein